MLAQPCAIIGSGPNGLAAAIRMAQAGRTVTVYEAEDTIGGGCRSAEVTLPGFVHDVCSAIHPLGVGSPFFRTLALHQHGLRWIHPDVCLAHPFDDGTAAILDRQIDLTASKLGVDGDAYNRLIEPLMPDWNRLCRVLLRPSKAALHPIAGLRFGSAAIQSAKQIADRLFRGDQARGLLAGLAAHSFLPLDCAMSGGFGLVLAIFAHAVGWPIPKGGSQRITDALVTELERLGGTVLAGKRIGSLTELPEGATVIADVAAKSLATLAAGRLSDSYIRAISAFRPGPAVFKLDYALTAPVPWTALDCRRAGTVHLGGTFEEIALSEHAVSQGECPQRPFVLVAQQSLFDPARAPSGRHTLWAYCHVPLGSAEDMTTRIEAQIERFAPGFADRILARHVSGPAEIEAHNMNCIGGDISGGEYTVRQMIARPTLGLSPWSTGDPNLFLCSASTPPGGGVHGMCGYYAAQSALGKLWR